MAARRAFAAGGVWAGDCIHPDETSGVFAFLRTQTVQKIGHKAAERLRVQLALLSKS